MHFYAIFFASPFETFTQPLVVWYCYVWFSVHAVIRIKVPVAAIVLLWGWCLAPDLNSIEGPCWILAFLQTVVQVLLLFLQLEWTRADGFCPMKQCPSHAIFGWYGMMAVPMQILVCICWLSMDSGLESALFIWSNQHI